MATPDPAPVIKIREAGPYEVSDAPVGWTAQIETEYGEPVDWAPFDPIPTGSRVLLCRCGRSKTKPFCDDSHENGPWDDEPVASREPRDSRAQTFTGDGVSMTDDHSFCTHAGYCGDRFTNVWRMIGRTSDPAIREHLQQMVDRCPSGTIDHAPAPGMPAEEPVFEASVAISRDGPIWVRGGIRVEGPDGDPYEIRNRVTLCRCGGSSNKPFCDGSHKELGFHDD
jgi:CDGSH-type Zn-finger protein